MLILALFMVDRRGEL